MRTILVLCIAVTTGNAIAADVIYKCKGADGSTVFSARPCGDDASEFKVRPGPKTVEPPPTAAPAESAPGTPMPALMPREVSDAEARAEADRATADCFARIDSIDARLREIRDHDYANDIAFASNSQIAAARKRDSDPLWAARAAERPRCEERWQDTYNAARYR